MDLSEYSIEWPAFLGKPKAQKGLFGMGLGRVFEIEFENRPAIAKLSPSNKERQFYELLAPELNSQGVDTPKLLWTETISDQHLIVLEKIKTTLPENRWRVDNDVLQFLAKMHEIELRTTALELKSDKWTQAMNFSVKPFFELRDQDLVFDIFEKLRNQYHYLFESEHLISGDPSGRNWGIRENGNLVLFDWERVGLGTCALDLMGVAFGEPADAVFFEIAEKYLRHRNSLKKSAQDLARETQVARVHITAVMLNTHAEGRGHLSEKAFPYFKEEFPGWLRKTFL